MFDFNNYLNGANFVYILIMNNKESVYLYTFYEVVDNETIKIFVKDSWKAFSFVRYGENGIVLKDIEKTRNFVKMSEYDFMNMEGFS